MGAGSPQIFLLVGPMNVNVTVESICIFLIQTVQPQNTRSNQIIGRSLLRMPHSHRNPPSKNRSHRCAFSYLAPYTEPPHRSFTGTGLRPLSRRRAGNGIPNRYPPARHQRQSLGLQINDYVRNKLHIPLCFRKIRPRSISQRCTQFAPDWMDYRAPACLSWLIMSAFAVPSA